MTRMRKREKRAAQKAVAIAKWRNAVSEPCGEFADEPDDLNEWLSDSPLPLSDGTQADPRDPWPISIDERK